MKELISQDSFTTLLLCSYVLPKEKIEKDYKPFSQKEWVNFSIKIAKSSISRPSNLFKTNSEHLCSELRISSDEAERIQVLLSRAPSMALELEKFTSMGITVLTRADKNYPKRLKKVLKTLSPTILYAAGDLEILNSKTIGFVGSRKPSNESEIFTLNATKKAVSQGYTIVSGGSKGIDSIAHQVAIESNGKTIAILSDNMTSFLKKKENLSAILNKQLLVISPYHPNARFYNYTALDRNKYIYGLSELVIITASDYKKGGTWAGAIENFKNSWVSSYVMENEDSVGLKSLQKLGIPCINLDSLNSIDYTNLFSIEAEKVEETEKTNIFKLVWPVIENNIHQPTNIKILSKKLELDINQLNIWLRKAKDLGKVKYIDGEKVISSTFYNEELDKDSQLDLFKDV